MKKLFLLTVLVIISCTEEESCEPIPVLTTSDVTDITDVSATLNGTITPPSCIDSVTSQGFVYSENELPTIEDNVVIKNGVEVSYNLSGLNQNTKYYVRTFFTNPTGDYYGNEIEFSTIVGDAIVVTGEINDDLITSYGLSNISGYVESTGGGQLFGVGFCISTEPNPSYNDDLALNTCRNINDSLGPDFSNGIYELWPDTTYYIRAFAQTEAGYFYGNERIFTTSCWDGQGMFSDIRLISISNNNTLVINILYNIQSNGAQLFSNAYLKILQKNYGYNSTVNEIHSVEVEGFGNQYIDIELNENFTRTNTGRIKTQLLIEFANDRCEDVIYTEQNWTDVQCEYFPGQC